MLDHKQPRRPVIELLAPVHADVDAQPAAVLTDVLSLGQFVVAGLTREVLRHAAASVRPAPPRRLHGPGRVSRWGGAVLVCDRLREEQLLVGIEALAARPYRRRSSRSSRCRSAS
jgi:hypothetical protein